MKEEAESRRSWEQARMVAYFAFKPHVKKNTMNTMESFIKFPWEKRPDGAAISTDEINEIVRKYGRYYDAENDKFVN